MKQITEPLKLEIVWRGINHLQETIDYLYRDKDRKFTDKDMEELYYKLNDMSLGISDSKKMEWQLED